MMNPRDEVLRYHIWGNREGETEVEVGVDGEWVRYDDYTTLRELLAAVEAERDEEIARVVRITTRLGTETLRADRAERILAALRGKSAAVMKAAVLHYSGDLHDAICAAVDAAAREVT